MRSKKGILGLDTIKEFLLAIMLIAIIVVVMIFVVAQMRTAYEGVEIPTTGASYNETITSSLAGTALSVNTNRNCQATITYIMNGTGVGKVINSGNYTISGCVVKSTTGTPGYTGVAWNVTYTFSYQSNQVNDMSQNLTVAPLSILQNYGTWMIILGIVVLILIITLVITAVLRFSGRGIPMTRGESSEL